MRTYARDIFMLALVVGLLSAGPKAISSFKIAFKGAYFTTDHLGNLYTVKSDNSIVKYNNKGKMLTAINNKQLGKLEYMDVTNPFELYLYYRDQNRIVFTDNMLGFRGETDLNNLEIANISLIARTYDNQIWAWDQNDLQLKKYSKDLKLLSESGNSRMWARDIVEPSYLIDNEQQVLMSDPKVGIYIFDAFANYYKTIPIKGVTRFQVHGNKISFYKDKRLSIYDMKLLQWYHDDSIPADYVRYEPGYLFVHRNDSIYVREQVK